MIDKEAVFMFGFFGVIAIVLVGVIAFGVASVKAERACLERGWPEAKVAVTFALTPYCIKRVNQTDTVVALSQIR